MESLEDRRLLAVDISLPGGATGDVVFTGDIGGISDDEVRLSVDAGNVRHNLVSDGIAGNGDYADDFDFDPSANVLNLAANSANPFILNLLSGNDSLTVEGLILEDITFDGGLGTDALFLTGDASGADATYEPSVAAVPAEGFDGTIGYNDGFDSQVISFTGLEPIEDLTIAASLTIIDTGGADEMNWVAGPLSTGLDPVTVSTELTHQVNFGANPFELINFRNKDLVTLDGDINGDFINVTQTDLSDGLTTIEVVGFDGDDSITITSAQTDVLTVDGEGDEDTIDVIGTDALDNFIAGGADNDTITITDAGGEFLTVDGGDADDIIDILDTNAMSLTSVFGGLDVGTDTITIFDAHGDSLIVDGEGGADGITLFNTSTAADTLLLGSNGDDTIDVLDANTPFLILDAGPDNDLVQLVDSNAGLNLFSGGDDTDTLEYPPVFGLKLLFDVGEGSLLGPPDVEFTEFENILSASILDDEIDIASFTGGEDGMPNEIVLQSRFDAGIGEDVIDILFDGDTTGGPGPVPVMTQLRDNVAFITVLGGTDDDTLTVNLGNDFLVHPGDIEFVGDDGFDALQVTGPDGSLIDLIYTPDESLGADNAGELDLDGSFITFSGLEPILVTAVPATVTVDLSTLVLPEMVTFSNDGGVLGNSQVTFVNNPAEDLSFANPTVSLELIGNNNDNVVEMNPMDPMFDAVVTLGGGTGVDTYNINATTGTMLHTINSGANNDVINVGGGNLVNINAPLMINGDDDLGFGGPTVTEQASAKGITATQTLAVGDTLNIDDTLDATGNTYDLDDGVVNRVGAAAINYATVESLDVQATLAGGNTINVIDTTDNSTTRVVGGNAVGGDDINVTTTGLLSITVVEGGGGDDDIDITTTGDFENVTRIDGQTGNDTITLATSGFIFNTGVLLGGGSGNDTIEVLDTGDISVTEIRGGDDDDTINITATGAGSATEAFGEGDNDTATIGAGAMTLDGVLGIVGFVGGTGGDTLVVEDSADTDDNVYNIDAMSVVRMDGPVNVMYDGTTEDLFVNAGQGADKVVAIPSQQTTYHLDGSLPTGPYSTIPGDTLSVNPIGTTITDAPFQQTAGTITFSGGFEPINFTDFEQVVLPDRFENNDNANGFPNPALADLSTKLGSLPEITLDRLSIHGPDDPATELVVEDTDFYQYTAHSTGKLIVRALFEHEFGDLELTVLDADGDVILNSDDSSDAQDLEEIIIPVVGQQIYYIQVNGVTAQGENCNVNNYVLEIENFAAPTPTQPDLIDGSDTGMMNDDNITADNTPTIEVTADLTDFANMGITIDAGAGTPGADVVLTATSQTTGIVTTLDAGRVLAANNNLWTGTFGVLADDEYVIEAWVRIEDGATPPAVGRSPIGQPLTITIDATAPAAPVGLDLLDVSDTFDDVAGLAGPGVIGSSVDDITSKMEPAFTGSGEPNAKVRLFADGQLVGQSVVTDLGLWEITSEPLRDGGRIISAELEDLAGNISPLSVPLPVTIDTLAPQRPTLDLVAADDSGMSDRDNVTNAADPLNFRVTAEVGSRVLIKDGETVIDDYVQGALVETRSLSAAEGTHLLSAEAFDVAGNRSAQSAELVLTVDRMMPAPSTPSLAGTSDTGILGDGITSKMQPAIVGVAEANAKIRVFANNTTTGTGPVLVGQGVVNSDPLGSGEIGDLGTWEVTLEPLTDGDYEITTEVEDLAGNISLVGGPLQITIDAAGPQRPTIDLVNTDDTGSSDMDNVTIGDPDVLPLDQVADFRISAELGSTVVIKDGEVVIDLFTFDAAFDLTDGIVDGFGIRRIDFAANELVLGIPAEGPHPLSTEATDLAGNFTQSEQLLVEIDTTAPAIPVSQFLAPYSDSGIVGDGITSVGRPAITGLAEANAIIRIYADGILVGEGLVGSDESDVSAGGTADDGVGIFEVTLEPLFDGVYTIETELEDLAGNVSATSDALTIYIDSLAPQRPTLDLPTALDTGMSSFDNITSAADPILFTVTVDEGENVTDPPFGPLTVVIKDGNTIIDTFTSTGGATTRTLALAEGTHLLSVETTDVAGNRSVQSEELVVVIDRTAPATPGTPDMLESSDSFDDVQGIFGPEWSNTDDVTNKMSPAFSGVAEANAKVRVYATNTFTGTTTLIGQGLVNSDESDFNPGDGLGTWEVTVEPLIDAVYMIDVELEDLAGNISPLSPALRIAIDTLPPQRPTLDLPDALDTGMSELDNVTNTPDLVQIDVTAEPGARVLIKDGEVVIDDFVIVGASTSRFLPFGDGTHLLSAEAFDVAGNRSAQSEQLNLTIDRTSPLAPSTPNMLSASDDGISNADNITSLHSPAFDGIGEPNSKVRLYANGELVGQSTVTSFGLWEITSEPLGNGAYFVTAELEDLAGNISPMSLELPIIVDPFEPNDTIDTATVLGSIPKITLNDVKLHDTTDVDIFKVTAMGTGKLIIDQFFDPAGGFMSLRVLDGLGNVIDNTPVPITGGQQIVIPVVNQEMYFLEITQLEGSEMPIDGVLYDLEIEFFATPTPDKPLLSLASDSGMMNDDNVTNIATPTYFITADLTDFDNMGITIDGGVGTPGAEVVLGLTNTADGTRTDVPADRVSATNSTFWSATPAGALPDGVYLVQAWTRIEDGQTTPAVGRSPLSEPMILTIDTQAPAGTIPDVQPSSDSGMDGGDHVTNKMAVAFVGSAEPNAKVRILADGGIVGEGVATTDGRWEITTEPLIDGQYLITAEIEDLAGNVTVTEPMTPILIVDTAEPNTPYLDLLTDTGHSPFDNITSDNTPTFLAIGNDTIDGGDNPFPNDVKYRIYWRPGDGQGEVLVYDTFAMAGDFVTDGQRTVTLGQGLNDGGATPFPDGVHNFKLEVEDRAGNISHDFLLDVEIDTAFNLPEPAILDLIDSSDTGMDNRDNVTSKMAPAFSGIAEVNSEVRIFAQQVVGGVATGEWMLVGEGVVGSDQSDTAPPTVSFDGVVPDPAPTNDDGLGLWEVTVEPMDDGVWNILAEFEDWGGNVALTPTLQIEIDSVEPNTPLLDLATADDSGISNRDNVTNVNTPLLAMTTHDPNAANHSIPENFKYRLYDRFESSAEVLIFDSAALAITGPDGGFTALTQVWATDDLTLTGTPLPGFTPLADGVHHLKLEVEDRAGNISHDYLLDLVVDTTVPVAVTPDMLSVSDSGMLDDDNVTQINRPAFAGVGEAGSEVRLLSGTEVVGIGQVGSDESDGTPDDGLGAWEVTVEPLDNGAHTITTEFEDLAGNISTPVAGLDIWIDAIDPNLPQLDLLSDTGHSSSDNITSDNTPEVSLTINDTVDGDGNPFPNDLKYRIYVRPDGNLGVDEVLIIDSAQLAANAPDGFTTGGFFTHELSLLLNDDEDGTIDGTPFPDGVHDLKLVVEDRAGNISERTLTIEVDTVAPPATVDLIASSDTGMYDDDDVTNKMSPAFSGVSEVGALVYVFAQPLDDAGQPVGDLLLVGEGQVGSDETDVTAGVPEATETDRQGLWEVTVEPLRDGVYDITTHIEDWAGNTTISEPLRIEIDTYEPNLPHLELIDDTGHSDDDNITGNNMPNVAMTTHEPAHDGGTIFQDNLKFRIYDRFDDGALQDEFLLYDSAADAAADAVNVFGDMFTALTQITTQLPKQLAAANTPAVIDLGEGNLALADGFHNLKLEVEDRAGNISHDFLLTVEVDTGIATPTIDMIDSSDTGMFDDDNVTSKMSPAFAGIAEADAAVRIFAQQINAAGDDFGAPLLIGQGLVGSDLSDVLLAGTQLGGVDVIGDPDDGLGLWEVTVEPLDDGVYDIFVETEDWAGNTSISEDLRIEIDTIEPNTAFLDLVEASDSGRHDDDNVTNDDTPTVTMTTHDTNVALHQVLFTDYLKFRIYDRLEESDEVLLYASAADAAVDAVSTGGDGFTSLTLVTETLPQLADGFHNLKLEVEDRAGNISHDFLLDVLIDTVAYQGDVHLHPESDSGVWGYGATMLDRITSDKVPDFFGVAEANNIVTVTIDGDLLAGTTVAIPLDGDDAFQPQNAPYQNVEGNWQIATVENLTDGEHSVVATFEDLAGNRIDSEELEFFVDTVGPRITAVEVNEEGHPYDLFDPKPSTDGPTPPVDALVISVSDLPPRTLNFLYDPIFAPLANEPGHYQLVGDDNGIIPIDNVIYSPSLDVGDPATATITLTFDEPLPDDRYTLTISDSLTDVAGNALDGESNASEPQEVPNLPSGDGVHGGDFVARFTIDSRPELATWSQGVVYADINGNFVWDPDGEDNDFTNRDFIYNFGEITDAYFVGNFAAAGAAAASGFDKIGAYGAFNGQYQFLLDTDDDGVGDTVGSMAFQVNAIPVAGNFDGGHPGDEIGAFDGQNWYLDTDGNNHIDSDERFSTALRGIPVVGDFNGDGSDDLATFNNDTGVFQFDLDRDGTVDDQLTFGFSGFGEKPVAGDINLDGIDDIVMWVPKQEGQLPKHSGEFHFLVSDDFPFFEEEQEEVVVLPSNVFDPFSPYPLGNDLIAQFGDDFALPLFGNFDPPVNGRGVGSVGSLTNKLNPLDTNVDGEVTALDALVVINALARDDFDPSGNPLRVVASWGGYRLDASGDGTVSALDALRVINGLARQSLASEGESIGTVPSQAGWASSVDSAIADLDDDDDDLLELLIADQELAKAKS